MQPVLRSKFVKWKQCRHTFRCKGGEGLVRCECGSEWALCCAFWPAPREQSPSLKSPVLETTHRSLYCLISLQHLPNTYNSTCSAGFRACLCMSVIMCAFAHVYICTKGSLPSVILPSSSPDSQRSINQSVSELQSQKRGRRRLNKDILWNSSIGVKAA